MHYIIGIFTASFLAVLLLSKKGRNQADVFLGAWMIIISLQIFGYYSFVSEMIYSVPELMWLNLPYTFLHGPMLYLYTCSLTNPERFTSKKWLFHFALPLLMAFSALPIMFLEESERIMIYKNNGKGAEHFMPDWTVLQTVSGLVYIIITTILLQKHKKRILNQFSYQEKINLNWLRFLLYGMGITWVIIISGGSDQWIFSTSTVLLVFIGYFGIKQAGIFTDSKAEPEPQEEFMNEELNVLGPAIEKRKYAKSSLDEKTAKDLQRSLQHLMATERLFTEPELTLKDLATRLEIHPNYLSQVINDLEGVNFYDYINSLRIQEFKKMAALQENQKFTILAMAYECGFNSKSAFNRCFKKATDFSPSEYLKSIK